MGIEMIPYTEVDGVRTATDSRIKEMFERTVKDGLDKIVFYEATIRTADEFLQAMKFGDVLFYFLAVDGRTVGYTWLNRFENHTARQHFCVFKEHWGRSLDLGRFVLDKLIHLKDRDGNFLFDLLTGFVPAWNKRAVDFSLKCGGKTHGAVPNAIWNNEKKCSEDAIFIFYTRGDK